MRPLLIAACALLALGASSRVRAATEAECRQFHEECETARSAGYGDADVGICHVERLECPNARAGDPEAGVGKRPVPASQPPKAPAAPRSDPECTKGP